jgi:methylmalonyl-CoA/ethylmalonyl-CoA epimerase
MNETAPQKITLKDNAWKIEKLDHVGIAVKNLNDSISSFGKFGLMPTNIVDLKEQKLKMGLIYTSNSFIELMEPTDEDSVVARFLSKNGNKNAIHHIAFAVDKDLDRISVGLRDLGVNMVYPKPRIGVMGHPVNFCHPKSTSDILIELCEPGHA